MKHWTTKLLILFLFCLTLFFAYNYFHKPFLVEQTTDLSQVALSITPTPSKTPKKDLSDLEKVAQLLMVPFDVSVYSQNASDSAHILQFIKDKDPGFVLYFGEKISSTAAALASNEINQLFSSDDYAPLIAVDHEGGTVQRLAGEGFTKLDAWQTIVDDYSVEQQKAIFNQSAQELKAAGISVVLAPVVDLASQSAVLKTRASGNADGTYFTATNFIYSFAQHGIMSVLKHFPGLGSLTVDPHQALSSVELNEADTLIFSKLLDTFHNIGVMSTHVQINNRLDGKICSLSTECLSQFSQSYPEVILFSDDLSMKAALDNDNGETVRDISEAAIAAIRAGNNVLIFGKGVNVETLEQVLFALKTEYADSASFKNLVDQSVTKILNLKK